MPIDAREFFIQTITPLHVGAGAAEDSVVDLPTMRERATGWPIVPASSIKGVLRDGRNDDEANLVFGRGPDGGQEAAAAALVLTDARLLFLPARSLAGTYALITCPRVIERWQRDARLLGLEGDLDGDLSVPREGALVPDNSALIVETSKGRKLVLEDMDLDVHPLPSGRALGLAKRVFDGDKTEAERLLNHLAVVGCDHFDYLARNALEIIARVQLESESKTVKQGPWYEEAVPAEAVFYFFALAQDERHFTELTRRPVLQIGGQGSVGRGLVRVLGGE